MSKNIQIGCWKCSKRIYDENKQRYKKTGYISYPLGKVLVCLKCKKADNNVR